MPRERTAHPCTCYTTQWPTPLLGYLGARIAFQGSAGMSSLPDAFFRLSWRAASRASPGLIRPPSTGNVGPRGRGSSTTVVGRTAH
eukprot:5703478-Pyramimonas_sp.AAC.1